jgi:hypothetical protein
MTFRHLRLTNDDVRRLWADLAITAHCDMSAHPCSYDTLSRRARTMGLPARKAGGRARIDLGFVARLWDAGVSGSEIARHLGVSQTVVSRAAMRAGCTPRKAGCQPQISLAAYLSDAAQARYRRACLAAATVETAELARRGLVDKFKLRDRAALALPGGIDAR